MVVSSFDFYVKMLGILWDGISLSCKFSFFIDSFDLWDMKDTFSESVRLLFLAKVAFYIFSAYKLLILPTLNSISGINRSVAKTWFDFSLDLLRLIGSSITDVFIWLTSETFLTCYLTNLFEIFPIDFYFSITSLLILALSFFNKNLASFFDYDLSLIIWHPICIRSSLL